MALATKKLIAYIDQNIISNVVKAKEGRIDRPDLIELFETLNQGMRAEKLVCPRSWFHREEGSLTSLDPKIQRYLRYIGQVDFLNPFELEERQFFNAARVFLGEEPYYGGWRECLEDDPDRRLTRFHIDANMPMAIFNFREQRQRHAEELDRARSIVCGRTFTEQLALERSEVAHYLYESYPLGVQHLFAERPGGRKLLAAFLETDLTTAVVSMDLFTQLCASLLVHHNHRAIQTGDVTDNHRAAPVTEEIIRGPAIVGYDRIPGEVDQMLRVPGRRESVASVLNRSLNMFTLIALGTGMAYVYSVVGTLAPELFPASFRTHGGEIGLYFEAAAGHHGPRAAGPGARAASAQPDE